MSSLEGTWSYESFCPQTGTGVIPPQIAAPWAPRGVLSASTDAAGKITGKLTFAPGVELAVSGSITPSAGNLPQGVDLVGEGLSAIYKLRGFFIDGAGGGPVIVGTVVSIQNDLAKQPIGTSGPFVLWSKAS